MKFVMSNFLLILSIWGPNFAVSVQNVEFGVKMILELFFSRLHKPEKAFLVHTDIGRLV